MNRVTALLALALAVLTPRAFAEESKATVQMVTNADIVRSDRRSLQTDSPGFQIDLAFVGSISTSQRNGFISAVNRWKSIITQDLDFVVCVPAGSELCGFTFQQETCIDDLLIIAQVAPIDGAGGVLGQAGPCGFAMGKVRIGVMQFDSADANVLINQGLWTPTVLHEMGHVLGIGTRWEAKRLITPKRQRRNALYLGASGNAGLNTIWGPKAGRIIIENKFGPGTARGHWKEAVYNNELMTGFIENPGTPMPISLFTIKSLQDLGYVVDETQADPFPRPSAGRRLRSTKPKIPLHNDILEMEHEEITDVRPKKGREAKFEAEKSAWESRDAEHDEN